MRPLSGNVQALTDLGNVLQHLFMTEWEIWACATKLRADHGDLDGSIQAAMRADDLLEAGDIDGYGVWIRIMGCIAKLSKLERDDETLH